MWVAGSPTRITMPKDARRVEVTAGANFDPAATGVRLIKIARNGTAGQAQAIVPSAGAGYATSLTTAGGVYDVAAGDYFELLVYQDTGGALNVSSSGAGTWLNVRVLE